MDKELQYDDGALIAGFAMRDRKAFEAIYNRFFSSLFFFAKGYVTDDLAAEDIVTESFIKIWEKAGDFETMKKLQNFLYTVTRNNCINFLRGEKRKLTREQTFTTLSEDNGFPEEVIAIVYQHILDEVDKMPKQLKQIFKLSFIDGHTNEEVATQLNISYTTVGNYKNRLLNLLRDKFKGRDIFTLMVFFRVLAMFANQTEHAVDFPA